MISKIDSDTAEKSR